MEVSLRVYLISGPPHSLVSDFTNGRAIFGERVVGEREDPDAEHFRGRPKYASC